MDHEVVARQLLQPARQSVHRARLDEQGRQVRRRERTHAHPALAAGEPDRDSEVCLARPDLAEQDDVLPALDEVPLGEPEHLVPRDARLALDVEGVEGLEVREPRLLDPALDAAVVSVVDLSMDEIGQALRMRLAVLGGVRRGLRPALQDRRESQLLELLREERRLVRDALLTLLTPVDTGDTNDPRGRRSGSWGLGGSEHTSVALHYGEAEGR